VSFRGISMHALSRDADFYQKPCIYCQLDEPEDLQNADDEAVVCSHELMLVPQDAEVGVCLATYCIAALLLGSIACSMSAANCSAIHQPAAMQRHNCMLCPPYSICALLHQAVQTD
jgi:hypothetical protein